MKGLQLTSLCLRVAMLFPILRLGKMIPAGQPWRSLWVLGFRCQVSARPGAKQWIIVVHCGVPMNILFSDIQAIRSGPGVSAKRSAKS